MASYLLDTNHASPLVTYGHPLIVRIQSHQNQGGRLCHMWPVLTETLFGISMAPRANQNRLLWVRWQESLTCHIPDSSDAVAAAELQINLRRRGRQLATVDALIAITALRYDLTLLTTDGDFQAVPGLRLENWIA